MIYVTSDLHGYPLDGFLRLLQSVRFCEDDYLFVLGDVIDRGEYGADLLRWMSMQPNVQLILGNHEAMMLSCKYVFDDITEESLCKLLANQATWETWQNNGAAPTLSGLRKILQEEPDVFEGIWEYVQDAPCYETVETDAGEFILVHAGLENFQEDRPLDDYAADALFWARPDMNTRYFTNGKVVIFGHTPTEYLQPESKGKIIKTPTWICIDPGVALGNKPCLLRLDDLAEFYPDD